MQGSRRGRRHGWESRDVLGGRAWRRTIVLARPGRLGSIERDGHGVGSARRNSRGRDRLGCADDRRGGRAWKAEGLRFPARRGGGRPEREGSAISARWGTAMWDRLGRA